LQGFKRSGIFKNSVLQTVDQTPPKPSFLCVTVKELPMMLQLDNGASDSIVSTSLADKLNLPTIVTTPVVLQGITGKVSQYATQCISLFASVVKLFSKFF